MRRAREISCACFPGRKNIKKKATNNAKKIDTNDANAMQMAIAAPGTVG
jgi:hypothetical protein